MKINTGYKLAFWLIWQFILGKKVEAYIEYMD